MAEIEILKRKVEEADEGKDRENYKRMIFIFALVILVLSILIYLYSKMHCAVNKKDVISDII